MIRITVWNEFRHEKSSPKVAAIYPNGMHETIAEFLRKQPDFEVRTATLDEPEHGLTQEVLDNGPLRFTVKLEFNPLAVKGDTAVVETRLITLDAGSHLNRTAVSYSNLKESLPIVTGIVLHEPDGAVVADAAGGYMTYVDPTTGPDNGKIFMGAAFPAVVKEAKTVLFPIEEKKMRNNADGHVLVVSDYEPGADYVYYWGFAWDRADIKTAEAWNRYMADFAQKVRNPMTVSIR